MSLNFHSEPFSQLKGFSPIITVTHSHCIRITNDDGNKKRKSKKSNVIEKKIVTYNSITQK